jgi:DNA-binding beta-propeller fold protein YncE
MRMRADRSEHLGRSFARGVSVTEAVIAVIVFVATAVAVVVVLWNPKPEAGGTLGVAELQKVDPKLILFDEDVASAMETGFDEARGLAVGADDTIYVAGDEAIHVIEPSGKRGSDVKLDAPPRCLAVDTDGTLYVAMENRVQVVDPSGKAVATWPSVGEKAAITSIAVAKSGVYVAVFATPRIVLRYDKTGKLLGRIGGKDAERNVPGFNIPSPYFDLAMAPDGLLRVANTGRRRIEAYTRDGDLELFWGKSSMRVQGFAGCCNPVSFAIRPDGGFVTAEKGITRVKIYDEAGAFEGVVAAPSLFRKASDAAALDVAVDSRGRVLVLDRGTVRVFLRKKERPSAEETNE